MARWTGFGLAGASLALVLAAAAVGAQDKAQIVSQRQEALKGLWPNHFSLIGNAAKGDAAALAAAPDKAKQVSAEIRKIAAMFPPGTGRDAVPATRATPEVWSQRAEFEANWEKLVSETEKIAEVAKNGPDAVKAQAAEAAKACGACHGGPPKSGGKFRFEAS